MLIFEQCFIERRNTTSTSPLSSWRVFITFTRSDLIDIPIFSFASPIRYPRLPAAAEGAAAWIGCKSGARRLLLAQDVIGTSEALSHQKATQNHRSPGCTQHLFSPALSAVFIISAELRLPFNALGVVCLCRFRCRRTRERFDCRQSAPRLIAFQIAI